MEAECHRGLWDKGKKRKYLRRGEDRLPAWRCGMTWGVRPMVGALALVLGVVPIPAQFLTDDMCLKMRHSSRMKGVSNIAVSRMLLLGFPDDVSTGRVG